jgi:hypothetical protein
MGEAAGLVAPLVIVDVLATMMNTTSSLSDLSSMLLLHFDDFFNAL